MPTTLTTEQAQTLVARLAEAQRKNDAQTAAITSLNREIDALRETNAQLLRKLTSAFPYGTRAQVETKRVVAAWTRFGGVIEHVMPVMPIPGRP